MADVLSNYPVVSSQDNRTYAADEFVAAKAASDCAGFANSRQMAHADRDLARDIQATAAATQREILEMKFQAERCAKEAEIRALSREIDQAHRRRVEDDLAVIKAALNTRG